MDKRTQLHVGIIQKRKQCLQHRYGAAFNCLHVYSWIGARKDTTTEGGPLAALPLVNLYLYTLDCRPCVQMFQLKVVDLATWCAHGPQLRSFTPQSEMKTRGHSSQIDESSHCVVELGWGWHRCVQANGHAYAVGEGDAFIHKHRWTGTMWSQPVQSPSRSPEASLIALF